MPKYDIALVSPPSRAINHYRPPLSLMYVADWYRGAGQSVCIIDSPMKEIIRNKDFFKNRDKYVQRIKDDTLSRITDLDCGAVGISCYSPEYDEVKTLIQEIRKRKEVRIVVGGIHPTLKPKDFEGLADEIVRGRRDVNTAAYDLVDMGYYTQANPYAIRGVFLRCAYVLCGFGCPSQCTFCVAPALRPYYGVTQLKTPEQMFNEVMILKHNYGVDGFYFIDDLFTINWKKVIHFCVLVEDEKMLWGCSAKVSTLNEETIWAMAKAGCVQIDFGVERGTDEALREVKKGQTIKQVKQVFKWCQKYGIRTFANFIIGLPGETPRHREDIKRLCRDIKPTIVSVNVFQAHLGTEITHSEVDRPKANRWAEKQNRKYNSITRSLLWHLRLRYWRVLLSSRYLGDYIKQFKLLVKEAINQKWQ